jgi:hypothetical protein
MTAFEETCFSEYWENLPSLVEENSIVDPYNFIHRMALGKYIIEHIGGPDVWGTGCWKHWFWAYLAQTDWQWRSGRFESPNKTAAEAVAGTLSPQNDKNDTKQQQQQQQHSVKIDTDSWWGYMNLGFVVGVYCGAAKAGQVPPIQLSIPSLLTEDTTFQAIVDDWCTFFEGPHAEFVSRKVDLTKHPYDVYPLYDKVLGVHTTTLAHSLAGAKHLEERQPPDDLKVGLGWSKMVELLAAMGWPLLSLDSIMKNGAGYLPIFRLERPMAAAAAESRVNDSGGVPKSTFSPLSVSSPTLEYLKVHRRKEYVTCKALFTLNETPHEKLRPVVQFLQRISKNNETRSELPQILDRVTHGSPILRSLLLIKLLGLAIIPQTVPESAAWVVTILAVVGAIGTSYRRHR